jgi:assimilatory nitrate reductase catalytic subunit
LFRGAAAAPADDALMHEIESALGLEGPATLRYADRPRGQRRCMRLVESDGDARLEAFLLAGAIDAEAWIKPLLQEERPARAFGRALLMPGARPPIAVVARGRQVCSCFNVSEQEIDAALAETTGTDELRLAALQRALRCGTQCGSCKPELMRRVRAQRQAA